MPGYWRPSYDSELIEMCIRKENNCKGGWVPGDESCVNGHIGALCEECDIKNIKGEDKYFKDIDSNCVNCKFTYKPLVMMVILSLW